MGFGKYRCDKEWFTLPGRRRYCKRHHQHGRKQRNSVVERVGFITYSFWNSLTKTFIYIRTCYFVLGLIAKTQQGVELLGEIGWESVVSSNGEPEGLCVPLNLSRFLTVSINQKLEN